MHEICRCHNDLINLPLTDFNSSEMNLLMALCSKLKNRGDETISLSFAELRKLSAYKGKSNEQLVESLKNVDEKLLNIKITLNTKNEYTKLVLFPTFHISKNMLTVRVNPDFLYLLNTLTKNFTEFELEEFTSLKSRYSKSCYLMLKMYKYTGKWKVSIDDFRKRLDVPESYSPKEISRNVIKTIETELSPLFGKLTIEPIKNVHSKKHEIIKYEIYFDEECYISTFDYDELDAKPSGHICPICGKPLFEKIINGSNCWCHPNALKEKGSCKMIFNSIYEIKTYNCK